MRLVKRINDEELQQKYLKYLSALEEIKLENNILYFKCGDVHNYLQIFIEYMFASDQYESLMESLQISYNDLVNHLTILEENIENLDNAIKNLTFYLLEINGRTDLTEK